MHRGYPWHRDTGCIKSQEGRSAPWYWIAETEEHEPWVVLLWSKPGSAQDSVSQGTAAWEAILHFDWLSRGWEVLSGYPDAGEAVEWPPNCYWLLLSPG